MKQLHHTVVCLHFISGFHLVEGFYITLIRSIRFLEKEKNNHIEGDTDNSAFEPVPL